MKVAIHRGFVRKEFFDRILPIPSDDVVMSGWNEEGEDRHHWGMKWWDEWGVRCRQSWPFRYWLHHTFPITLSVWRRRFFKDPYWWVTHRLCPRHRYHVLPTGLPPGYYDPDTRFTHAIFEEITKFVEMVKDTVDWDYDEEHRMRWATLTNAADFWKGYKSYREHEFDSPHWEQAEKASNRDERHAHYLALHEEEEEWERQATAHLVALMRIRRSIWYP